MKKVIVSRRIEFFPSKLIGCPDAVLDEAFGKFFLELSNGLPAGAVGGDEPPGIDLH